jgi:hypothetical protein
MSLIKRGKTWHCHFVVNGQRFRQSLGTRDWREAQAKQKELIGQAMEGKITQSSASLARQPFVQAADDYEKARKLELATASLLPASVPEVDYREANHRLPDVEGRTEKHTRGQGAFCRSCNAQR